MPEINQDTVLAALSNHIGQVKGINGRDLVVEITGRADSSKGMRDLRKVIEQLREEGNHICAHPGSGYFIAVNDEDVDRTCRFLYARAMTSLMQISRMKKVAIPDIRGQLRLPS